MAVLVRMLDRGRRPFKRHAGDKVLQAAGRYLLSALYHALSAYYLYTAWVANKKISMAQGLPMGLLLLVVSIALAYACLKLYDTSPSGHGLRPNGAASKQSNSLVRRVSEFFGSFAGVKKRITMIPVKGYAAQSPTTDLAPWNFERRDVGPHDVKVDIAYCGVCHSDLHQIRDEWFKGIFRWFPVRDRRPGCEGWRSG